jgi:hypothetical protein
MTIEISTETEARLTREAQTRGVSVDALVEQILGDRGSVARATEPAAKVPILHLGVIGSLRRRDIYDDAD